CSGALLFLTHRMLQDNLSTMIAKDSRVLSAVSRNLLPKPTASNKQELTQLAKVLLKEPEILAIVISDMHKHVVAQAAKPISAQYTPFSLKFPVMVNHKPVGWIRAMYSPGLALESYWKMTGDWIVLLLCGTLLVFILAF